MAGKVVPTATTEVSLDGKALVVHRFDVDADGQPACGLEDFCSLLGMRPAAKYETTWERIAKAVRDHVQGPSQRDTTSTACPLAIPFAAPKEPLIKWGWPLLQVFGPYFKARAKRKYPSRVLPERATPKDGPIPCCPPGCTEKGPGAALVSQLQPTAVLVGIFRFYGSS